MAPVHSSAMLGSLIGIFITSAGIVIGADSAIPAFMAADSTRVEKICRTSPRTVAVIQGWYGERLYLHRHFHRTCGELSQSKKTISVEQQADRLIQKIEKAYRDHIGPRPREMANLPLPSTQHVVYLAVAGFQGTIPLAAVRELRWERNAQGHWQIISQHARHLSLERCGAKFIGETTIAVMLLEGSDYFAGAKDRPEVTAGRKVTERFRQDDCGASSFSVPEAKALYKTAVRMTIDHGQRFLLEGDDVGGRLHLVTIPSHGPIEAEVIDPEQYLE
ncbi:MAG: hypothetical protein GDA67_06235 [Nitrospira sp. CR1.3]|nr:hypothetical protein [Nitrospira sp. CR1.3]